MNLAQLVSEYVERDRAKKALTAEVAGLRDEIDRELRAEYERTGLNPTLRLPGVGTVLLAGGGTKAVVHQPTLYGEWVAENHPERANLVIRVPAKHVPSDEFQRVLSVLSLLATSMDTEVDPDLLDVLASSGTLDADVGALVTEDGQLVDGVRVVKVDPTLSIRPAKA